MNARQQRGLAIAALAKIVMRGGKWVVPSQSAADKKYEVSLEAHTCSCPDHQETGLPCKHQYAVEFVLKREFGEDGTVTETRQLLFEEKKTYTQNWPAYNKAQRNEKRRLQVLLADLCRSIQEPQPHKNCGRPPIPMKDAVFACTYKVYSTVSSRRFNCDLEDAHANGHISRPIHCNKINKMMEAPAMFPILKDLIVKAALPLRAIESDFAIDSSGFSTGRHVRWFDEKYGVERSGHDWVKVHIATGVKTNVVTAIEIHGRDTGDAPLFGSLAKATAQNFKVKELSADKAYLSEENIATAIQLGAEPYIPFKVNSTGGIGGFFEKLFHTYSLNREAYLAKYHKRSNVETTFHMVQSKFGSHVRSRTDTAMKNEVLCKFLCHNLCCVIQSECELGSETPLPSLATAS